MICAHAGNVKELPGQPAWWRDRILWLICALALVLRLVRLGHNDLWHDEVHNLLCAEFLGDLLRYGHLASNHPPLPYILLRGWRELGFGPDEFSLRLLPVLAGTAGVATLYLFARLLFGRSAALWSACLLALSPYQLLHAQDLKEYIYLPALVPLIGYFIVRATRERRLIWWLLYGISAGLGCYTEAFVAPLLVALNLWAMAKMYADRAPASLWAGWCGGNLLGAALFVPWLAIMLRKAVATMVESTQWWVPKPGMLEVAVWLKTIAYGYCVSWLGTGLAVLAFYGLVLWGSYAGWRERKRWEVGLLMAWLILPASMVFVISHITQSIFLLRALLPYAVGAWVLAGLGIQRVQWRPAVSAVLIGALSWGLAQYYARDFTKLQYPHRPGIHPPQPFRQAVDYIVRNQQEGDLVLHASHANWLPFLWYGLRGRPMKNAGAMEGFIRYFELANPRNTPNPIMDGYFPESLEMQVSGFQRIWFVFGEWERESLGDHALIAWRWLDSHYTETDRAAFGDLDIRLYEPREVRPVRGRIRDNGLAAEEILGPGATQHIKVMPDASLDGAPPVTPLKVAAEGSPLGLLLELDPEKLQARLVSSRESPVRCQVEWAYSSACVSAASFARDNIRSDTWLPVARYNPSPPPRVWHTTMFNANLQHGAGTASATMTLPAGMYQLWASLMGPVPSDRYLIAPLTLSVNGAEILSLKNLPAAQESRNTVDADTKTPPSWRSPTPATRPFPSTRRPWSGRQPSSARRWRLTTAPSGYARAPRRAA